MAFDASAAALWLYRQADRTGVLSVPVVRRMYEILYGRYKRHVEDPFYNLASRHPELFRGGHILDVGANIGYTAEIFAGAIDPGFRVYAFEPTEDHVRRLHARVAARRLADVVTVRHVAVSDRRGVGQLVLNPDNPADHRLATSAVTAGQVHETVELTTLDEEVRRAGVAPVAFIKIDVQGCEMQVCRGMTATLDANPSAAVVLEYMPELMRTFGDDPALLPPFFADRGYTAYTVAQRGTLRPMSVRDFQEPLPARGYFDVLFTRSRGVQP